jgi:rubredoxin
MRKTPEGVPLLCAASPTKVGIVQRVNINPEAGASWLNPVLPCCLGKPVWNAHWMCRDCGWVMKPQPTDPDMSLENVMWITQSGIRTTSAGEIKRWICKWTGLEFDEFELGMEF